MRLGQRQGARGQHQEEADAEPNLAILGLPMQLVFLMNLDI